MFHIKLNTNYLQNFIHKNNISLETFLVLIKLNGLNNQVPFNDVDKEFFTAIYNNRVNEIKQTTLSVLVNALKVHELNLIENNTQTIPTNDFFKINQKLLQEWIDRNGVTLKHFINSVECIAKDNCELLSPLDIQRFKRYYKNTQFTVPSRDLSILICLTGIHYNFCLSAITSNNFINSSTENNYINFDTADVDKTFKLNNSFITKRLKKLNLSVTDCIINFTEMHNYPFDLNVKLTLKWLTKLFTGNQVSAKKRTITTLAKVLNCSVYKLLQESE
jgi:hypothetical protein